MSLFNFSKVRYEGLHLRDNKVLDLGKLTVESDEIEIQTGETDRYSDPVTSRQLFGAIKQSMNEKLLRDIPFEVHFSLADMERPLYETILLDGQIEIKKTDFTSGAFSLNGLSPEEIFAWDGAIQASQITMHGTFERDKVYPLKTVYRVDEGASFYLGKTKFEVTSKEFAVDRGTDAPPPTVTATAMLEGQKITATVVLGDQQPFTRVQLRPEVAPEPASRWLPVIWAKVVYGKTYDELSELERARIDASTETD